MAIEGLSQDEIDRREAELLVRVLAAEAVGNVTLRWQLSQIGWDEGLYWDIRNRLIGRGVLVLGKGKGGSVCRVSLKPAIEIPESLVEPESADRQFAEERSLYKPMTDVIKSRWAQDKRLDALVVETTAAQGARPTGGKWTRPDITVASYRTFPYVPGRHFDVITFEVKPYDTLDVTVV